MLQKKGDVGIVGMLPVQRHLRHPRHPPISLFLRSSRAEVAWEYGVAVRWPIAVRCRRVGKVRLWEGRGRGSVILPPCGSCCSFASCSIGHIPNGGLVRGRHEYQSGSERGKSLPDCLGAFREFIGETCGAGTPIALQSLHRNRASHSREPGGPGVADDRFGVWSNRA